MSAKKESLWVERFGLPTWLFWFVAGIYSLLVLTCAAHHEAWFDEAQSWLLARDTTPWELFTKYSRYEGTPALWQLLLMPFAKLGFPYERLSFLSAALGILGVLLFLRRAPFPLGLKVLFPFCFFPLFQYAVVARSYALFPPLLFGIATLFRRRIAGRSGFYLFLVALLANASLHGLVIASVLLAEWFHAAWRGDLPQSHRRLWWTALVAFTVLYILLAFQLRLPPDIVDRSANAHHAGAVAIRICKQISEAFWGGLGGNVYRAFSTIVGVVVIAWSLWRFRATGPAYLFFGSLLPLLALAGWKQAANWHAGIIFLIWVFSLWVYFEGQPSGQRHQRLMYLLMGLIFVVQSFFGLRSILFDDRSTYSGSKAAAVYLAERGQLNKDLWAIGFKTFALQPYFHRNLFIKQEHGRDRSFYSWRQTFDHEGFGDLTSAHPALVIVGNDGFADRSELDVLQRLGYCEARRFEGSLWWKNARSEPDTYVFMVPCQ